MKKLILAIGILLCSAIPAFANTCVFTGAGGANASDATNYSGCGGVAPTTGDAVVLDGAFPVTGNDNLNWDITADLLSFNATGYSGVVTASVTMTVSGDVTFPNNTFAHGNQLFIFDASATITMNNNALYDVDFTDGGTFALAGGMTISDDVILVNAVNTSAFNGNGSAVTMYVGGDVTATNGRATGSSSSNYVNVEMNGSSAQVFTGNTDYTNVPGYLRFNNSSGGISMAGGLIVYKGVTHISGSVNFSTNTVSTLVKDLGTTIDITSNSGFSFYNFSVTDNKNVTLNDNASVANTLDIGAGAVGTSTINGYKFLLSGNFSNTGGNQVTGSTGVEWTGSGNQTWSQANTTYIILATGTMTFNKSGGAVTLSGDLRWDGTIVHTAGSVTQGTSVLYVKAAQTINTGSGMSWYDINQGANITMGSDLQFSHNFTRTVGAVSGAYFLKPTGATTHVIDGTNTISGFDCASGETCSFDDADIFTITNSKGNGTWQSDDATNTVDIDFTAETITSGAGTRVDSAGGVAVTTSGTITDCVNWSAPSTRKLIMVVA